MVINNKPFILHTTQKQSHVVRRANNYVLAPGNLICKIFAHPSLLPCVLCNVESKWLIENHTHMLMRPSSDDIHHHLHSQPLDSTHTLGDYWQRWPKIKFLWDSNDFTLFLWKVEWSFITPIIPGSFIKANENNHFRSHQNKCHHWRFPLCFRSGDNCEILHFLLQIVTRTKGRWIQAEITTWLGGGGGLTLPYSTPN